MEEQNTHPPDNFSLPSPSLWLSNFIPLQSQIISTSFISLLSPFLSILSLFSDSFRPENAKENVESAVQAAANGNTLLLKKLGVGLLAAFYVFVILAFILVLAFILGIGLVRVWVEQPVILREGLHFDYTKVYPVADFAFGSDYGGFEGYNSHWELISEINRKFRGVPVGHTYYVSLVLLVPESDYNRDIGVFQLTAEIISSNGQIMEKATHPCMLRFRSWPIRMVRTFVMAIPLLLGLTGETQTIQVPMLKHKEDFTRSAAIRIILSPRARTDFLPQLYDAEILLNSQLPWWKELVRRWKWTLYVWTSMYIYIILLLLVLCFFRPLIFPDISRGFSEREQNLGVEASGRIWRRSREESDVSRSMRRSQQSRNKRKAMLVQRDESRMPEAPGGSSATSMSLTRDESLVPEPAGGSSATSMSLTREEDTGVNLEEETGDSESVCS